ncbi:MAG: PfkB family carbohydrate kinase [Gammaproteobacteria bacterium]|nr:PfkB family carbohydrate kinase [Gammaproteobacteria bacterium]
MPISSPIVMSVAELDPTGAGGLAADIETLGSLACHCTPIVSSINIQDTQHFMDCAIIEGTLLMEQMRVVLEDINIAAIKLHQLATTAHIESIHTVLTDYPTIPVIIDPALWSVPVEDDFCDALCALLLPQATLLVVTAQEAFDLTAGADSLTACAHELLDTGCENLLICSDPGSGETYTSKLFSPTGLEHSFQWQNLPNDFLGAGSTFAAAITAFVAHGVQLRPAIRQAQEYTWKALANAKRLGMGRLVPNRLPGRQG